MGTFQKGHKPWNKGNHNFRPSKDTEFKPGEHIGDKHPSWKGGIQKISKDCVYLWKGPNKRIRRPRQVYEEHYGKIPKGYIIWHIDGDKHNDVLDNLEAISRAECMKRNFQMRWE